MVPIQNRKTKKPKSVRQKALNPRQRYPTPKLSNNQLVTSVAMRRSIAPKATTLSLSKCALKYALALSDPLSIQARGACIPVGATPTMKTHAFMRFDVVIGSAGYGVVAMAPSLANDMPSVYYTNGLYGGTGAINPFLTAGSAAAAGTLNAGWVLGYHNGPFAAAQLVGYITEPTLQGRMVAVGARAQYIGTTLDESGLYYCFHDPAHSSIAGQAPINVSANADAHVEAVTRSPCQLTMFSINDNETNFTLSTESGFGDVSNILAIYPYSGGNNVWDTDPVGSGLITPYTKPTKSTSIATFLPILGVPTGCIIIQGKAGSTVHLEVQFHMEYTGQLAATMLSSVTPDTVGAHAVRTSALAMPQKKLANPGMSPWDVMYAGLREVYNAAKPIVVPALQQAVMALVL